MLLRKRNLPAILFILSLFFTSSLTLHAQNAFEGKVKFKVSGGDGDDSSLIDYFVKDDKIRMEVKDAMGAVIIFDQKSVKMIMESQGMYMEYPRDMMMGDHNEEYENMDEGKAPKITDKKKDILGYECTLWTFESDEGLVEMWVTDELGSFVPMQSPMGGGEIPAWQQEIADGNFFPMSVIVNDDGDKVNAFEVVEVNKQDLNSDLFTVPKGLKKMDMPFKMN
jgi:hypothetical protein